MYIFIISNASVPPFFKTFIIIIINSRKVIRYSSNIPLTKTRFIIRYIRFLDTLSLRNSISYECNVVKLLMIYDCINVNHELLKIRVGRYEPDSKNGSINIYFRGI